MGGRGAKLNRNTNPYSKRPATAGFGGATQAGGGPPAADEVNLSSVVASRTFPQIKSFSQKNIVDFNYKLDSSGTITIKDDTGRTFKGTYEGHGASRDTFGFKEGFVVKFDGLKGQFGFRPGEQSKAEVKAYKNLNKALLRPAGKTPKGGNIKAKARVPELISAHLDKRITLADGTIRPKVTVTFMTKARGAHDTGVKADSPKGQQLIKRVKQYIRGLGKRGVSTSDFAVGRGKGGTVKLHNIYRDKRTGRLTIVDLGL